MRDLSALAKIYIWATLCLGDLVFLWSDPSLPSDAHEWLAFASLGFAAAAAQSFPVVTPKNQSYELTPIFVFAAVLLLPPELLAPLVVLAFIPEWIKARKPWFIQLFNISIYLVQVFLARAVYLWVGGDPAGFLGGLAAPVGAVVAATAFTAVNHLLLAVVLRLARGHSWKDTRLLEVEYFLTDATLACTGIIAALLWQVSPPLMLLVAAPLFLIYRALNTPNLQEEARTDPKTDLYNLKHFNRVLREEIRRAERFSRPLAVVMADLDFLREINNRYGHMAGDLVIQGVAEIIKRGLREYDVGARFGGEEFVLLFPETDAAAALMVAERIRRQVEEARFAVPTSVEPIRATLSLGVASFPTDGDCPEEVVHQADLAVYYAKRCGRNRVWVCSHESRALGDVAAARQDLTLPLDAASPKGPGLGRNQLPGIQAPRGAGQAPLETGPAGGEASGQPPERGDADGAARAAEALPPRRTDGDARGPSRRGGGQGDPAWPIALFISTVVLATLALWLALRPWEARLDWLGLGAVGILTIGAQSLAIDIYGRGRISTSAITIMAGGMIFGLPGALFLAPLVPVTGWLRNRGRLYRAVFDLGDITFSAAVAVVVYEQLSSRMPSAEPIMLVSPAALAALAYYAVNVGLISVAMALTEGRSPFAVWNEKFRWLPLHYLVFGPLALLIAMGYHAAGIYGLLSFFVPAVMLRYVMKQYIDRTEANVGELKRVNAELVSTHGEVVKALEALRATYDATLVALSAALDSRDAETEGHCQQVVAHTAAIARELGLPEQQIAYLLNGALLHDVGKIGVPDAILGKRGPLTEVEWQTMRLHPELGYRMLEPITFLKDALPIVRHHHERYDGKGYPDGLAGEEIPLGARIFAVADALHAMTSNRPYRPAQPVEDAREEIARGAGTQFDPGVVDAFLRLDLSDPSHPVARSAELEEAPRGETGATRGLEGLQPQASGA